MKILVDHTIQYNNTQYYGHIEDILTMDYRHVMPVAGPIINQDYC
jgi:hypothetical protein